MIYLDNNSTTILAPEVFSVMEPLMKDLIGNPSSIHLYGQRAKGLLADALKTCSDFFQVICEEIVFTSGATEALNFLIHSIREGHVITSSLEHSAIIEPLKASRAEITYLDPPVGKGAIEPAQIENAIQENTKMIILSAANNETGICIHLEAIAALAEKAQIPFVLDGVAFLGKASFHLPRGIAAACFSGHKIHGPQGIGLVVLKKSFKRKPLILGGPQQRGLRAGTENLPAIIGLTKALELLDDKWVLQMAALRDHFEATLIAHLPDIVIHGKDEKRICNTTNIAFLGVDGETLLMALDLAGVAASHGSACSSAALSTSRVLLNMKIDPKIARSSIRFSFSRFTTFAEVEKSIDLIIEAVTQLRC